MAKKKYVRYNKDVHDKLIFSLAMTSKTKTEIANKLKIDRKTLDNWLKKKPTFKQAYLDGKLAESVATKGLADATKDKQYTEVKKNYIYNEDGEKVLVGIEERTKTRHASVEAQKFLLKNRNPEKWDNKETLGSGGEPLINQLVSFLDAIDKEGINLYMDKAYSTHRQLCIKYGITPIDRRTFFVGKSDFTGCIIDGHAVDKDGFYIDNKGNYISAITGEIRIKNE